LSLFLRHHCALYAHVAFLSAMIAAFSLSGLCHHSDYLFDAMETFSHLLSKLCLIPSALFDPLVGRCFVFVCSSIPPLRCPHSPDPYPIVPPKLFRILRSLPRSLLSRLCARSSLSLLLDALSIIRSLYASFAPDAFPRSSSDRLRIRYRVPSSPHIRSFRCCRFWSYPLSRSSRYLDVPRRLSRLLCHCVVPDVW
jgi:hypothetical protein